MRKYLSTILIGISLFVGEVHTFWEGGAVRTQNWILKVERPMALQWNIKYVCMQAQGIIIAFALLYYHRNRINNTVAAAFVFYNIADTVLYFYNYKLYGYGYVYLLIVLFGIIYYYWQFNKK